MGDLTTEPTDGQLLRIRVSAFEELRKLSLPRQEIAAVFSDLCRINILYMIERAGSGHIGSSFSCIDIMVWLHLFEMSGNDTFFSSKGHDAPALYALLIAQGTLPFEKLDKLRRLNGLPGHPDVSTPGIVTNTGSLGMGISKAKGMLVAQAFHKREGRIFVLLGDGELQEGQIWESLVSAANDQQARLTAIVDLNRIQSDFLTEETMCLGCLKEKFESFGWHVFAIDGHDFEQLNTAFEKCSRIQDKPQLIIARTIKGKGVSLFEKPPTAPYDRYKYHSGAVAYDEYVRAVEEITTRVGVVRESASISSVWSELIEAPSDKTRQDMEGTIQHLISSYGGALLEAGKKNPTLVALDADLSYDMGLSSFRQELPRQFKECGIAEQDMVSQAGGMALNGLLPICHSFACFLTTRANEQIYNNASEGSKIIYVGGLAGVLPGGPGHSHQSVRDISALGAIPGLVIVEPCTEVDTWLLLEWCISANDRSSYLRLVSIPWPTSFPMTLPSAPVIGVGELLREGSDIAIVAAGPIMLSQAWLAANHLEEVGISAKVIAMPWLNRVDQYWLMDTVRDVQLVVTIDNHFVRGGQGEMIAAALARDQGSPAALLLGLHSVPPCGTHEEVLRATGLDVETIVSRIQSVADGK